MFNIMCVVVNGTLWAAPVLLKSKERHDSTQQVLRKCTIVCRLLVAIVMDELYFEAFQSILISP
jgi:hypothetical protein